MTTMKTTLTKLLLLMSLLCAATSARAATLTISGGDGKPVVTRFQTLSFGLEADVQDPPKTNEEVEITGPTYYWSGGGMGLSIPGDRNTKSVSLSSHPFMPSYGGGGARYADVSCIATYTSINKITRAETPIPISGQKRVEFYVRLPKRIGESAKDNQYVQLPGSAWGHRTRFDLIVKSNDSQIYLGGRPREEFSNYSPNPKYAAVLSSVSAPGTPSIWPMTINGIFTDNNVTILPENLVDSQTNGEISIGTPDVSWYSFDQKWYLLEDTPTIPSQIDSTTLNMHHVEHLQRIAVRSGDISQ